MGLASEYRQKTTWDSGDEVLGFDSTDSNAVVNFTQAALVEAVSGAYAPQASIPGAATVYFGDSITYQSGVAGYADDSSRGATAYTSWFEAATLGRITPIANEGASGENTEQLLARVQDVIDLDPNLVVMQGGVNDVKGAIDAATTQANLTAIFDAFEAAGIYVICGNVTPSDLIDTTPETEKLFTVNRWLTEQGRTRRTLTVVDLYSLVADRETVDWRTGYDSDGTHQSPVGALVIGQAFADVVNHLFPAVTSRLTRSGADPYDLAPNPTMTGDTAGVATSVTRTGGTGTASKVARTDGIPGEWQQWVATSGNNFILQDATTGFSVGDRLVGRFELEAEDIVATQHFVNVECREGTTVLKSASTQLRDANGTPSDFSGVFELNPIVVPESTTSVRIAHRINGSGTVRVGTMSLRKAGE